MFFDEVDKRTWPESLIDLSGFTLRTTLLSYNEETSSALWYEIRGIDHERIASIVQFVEGRYRRSKVRAAVGCEEARNVFKKNQRRATALHFPKYPRECPECT